MSEIDRHNAAQATQEYSTKMSLEIGKIVDSVYSARSSTIYLLKISITLFPYRNEDYRRLFMTIAMYMPNDEMLEVIHGFFESLMSFVVIPTDAVQWTEESAR